MKPANLLAFYRTVADRSPIPVLIYSVPAFTNYDMPSALVIELAEHPNIIGIKESGGDAAKIRQVVEETRHIKRSATVTETFAAVTPRMLQAAEASSSKNAGELVSIGVATDHVGAGAPTRPAAQVHWAAETKHESSSAVSVVPNLKTRQKEVGFQVLAGAAQRLLPSLKAGAVGAVLAFASPAPTACYEVYAAWKEGDEELARIKQERIVRAATRVGAELGVPGLKYAADLNGYYGGPPRLPFLPLTADLKAEVERLMADIRN
jgi:4-hydroxy-2-oxoglutarate aldolase